MATYQVIASNKFFWQMLRVSAETYAEAAEKFTAYLAASQQQNDEEYEYEQQMKIAISQHMDDEDTPCPVRDEYNYDFDPDQIEATTIIFCGADVEMIHSGGNG